MANQDDTAKRTRGRRNQCNPTADTRAVAAASDFAPLPQQQQPQTLEEAIERVRTLLLEVRGMLHCLSEVLQYSDDDDGVMHAEVAHAAARWVNDSAADLDMVKLRPLIEAYRKREDESGSGNSGLYQVREQTAVYRVA
ncbi:hypothetical protein [Steroidobacter cummioxidans]|uniref:hypothetical protein n=1 Tax=Steroidobacter cummioxidans TaxID=1803913 RepID=UPI000E31B4A6|nr:hypothetical protein [Steroidobacter cummioxidans]